VLISIVTSTVTFIATTSKHDYFGESLTYNFIAKTEKCASRKRNCKQLNKKIYM